MATPSYDELMAQQPAAAMPSYEELMGQVPVASETKGYNPNALGAAGTFAGPSSEAFIHGATEAIPFGQKAEALGATGVLKLAKALSRVGVGPAYWQQLKDTSYDEQLAREREMLKKSEEEHPYVTGAGKVVGGGLSMGAMSPIKAAQGASALGRIGAAAGNAGLYGVAHGAGQGDSLKEASGNALVEGGTDTLLGGAGGLLSEGAGALGRFAGNKIANIDEAVARKAAEEAADETASAKSLAGRSAQHAYKQLEHLRELGRLGQLPPELQQAAQKLESELGAKAEAKLLPSIASKEEAADAYKAAMAAEGERANQIAADKLSGKELKSQFGARFKRYVLPSALGATAAHVLGVDPGLGATAGLLTRPMLHSARRFIQSPVAQRFGYSAIQNLSNLAAPTLDYGAAPALVPTIEPDIESLIAALRGSPLFAKDNEQHPSLAMRNQ